MPSTSRSSTSVNFSPRPENTLMPLSSNGLCDAEITMPASKSISRATYATAGVGMTPPLVRCPPAEPIPRASSRSIHSPDSRVSRPTMNRTSPAGRWWERVRTSAAPSRATVSCSSGYSPALPRTPSVPKSLDMGLLDRDLDDGGLGGADAEALRGIELDLKIVLARSEAGKVHEGTDRFGPHRLHGIRPPADDRGHPGRLDPRREPLPEVSPPDRYAREFPLDRRRQDLDLHRGVLRRDQADRRVGDADGDDILDGLACTRDED